MFYCILSCLLFCCGFMNECFVCVQKERYIQISKVDEEERKRREQQKLEKEQVALGLKQIFQSLYVPR